MLQQNRSHCQKLIQKERRIPEHHSLYFVAQRMANTEMPQCADDTFHVVFHLLGLLAAQALHVLSCSSQRTKQMNYSIVGA